MPAMDDAKKLLRDQRSIERELGLRGNLCDFIKLAWPLTNPGDKFSDNWSLQVVAEHLEAVNKGQIRNLVINVPPGSMKSRMTGLFWPVWSWMKDPSKAWGTWSFDMSLVLREAEHSLNLIQSDWFRARWGDKLIIKDKTPAKGEYWTTSGGLRFASTTPKGDATGWHFDYRVVDDPHKPQAISKVTLEESHKWWSSTFPSRAKELSTVRTVVVMQRLHTRDMAALAEDDGYVMLRIPMRFNPKVYSLPSAPDPVKWTDPRTEKGQLMWPSRFPEDEVKKLERRLGPAETAGQLQQMPVAEGGSCFKQEWFRTWVRPGPHARAENRQEWAQNHNSNYGVGNWMELPETFDQTICSWDCAFKDKDTSDYVCGQVWGRSGRNFFLLWEECDRMDFSQTCEAVKRMAQRFPGAQPIIIEDKANGIAVINTLMEEIYGLQEVDPQGGKISRANATTGTYAAGEVYHPAPDIHPWIIDHDKELTDFPFGSNDDRVDAMSQALIFLMQQFNAFGAAMNKMVKVIMPDANNPASKEEEKNAAEMLDLLYGMGRVL